MLSDGYRNVIKIILDIAARMCILNPYLKEKALQETPGIVLIDEIDLSLHPTWQKRIIGILKQLFPKIQFICATHSPFIIQSLEEGELITLDQPLESEYSGESIEDISEDIMGVVLPQYSEKKRKIYEASKLYFEALTQAKSQEDIDRLGKRLAELEAEYSENPAYMAWVHQQYLEQKWKVKKNETNKYCNTRKKAQTMPENKKNYLWPDEDNTAIAYSYINGIPKVNEELLIKLDSTGDYLKRARNTYNLVGLGNLPMGKDRDRRFGQRNTAYQKALNSLEHWNHMKDLSKEYQNDMKNQIIMTALGDGFFSIWMEVFCDEPEIRLALIEAFPGTNLNYYDEKGCVKEII